MYNIVSRNILGVLEKSDGSVEFRCGVNGACQNTHFFFYTEKREVCSKNRFMQIKNVECSIILNSTSKFYRVVFNILIACIIKRYLPTIRNFSKIQKPLSLILLHFLKTTQHPRDEIDPEGNGFPQGLPCGTNV